MTNKEKFLNIVKNIDTDSLKKSLVERSRRRDLNKYMPVVAFRILDRLKQLGWSQHHLAAEMGVTPQLINRILKGKENLSTDTYLKLQKALGISFLVDSKGRAVQTIKTQEITTVINLSTIQPTYQASWVSIAYRCKCRASTTA